MGFSRQEYWSGVPLPSPSVWLIDLLFYRLLNIYHVHITPLGVVSQKGHVYEGELQKAMAPHSSILAWKIPWTEEPCRLQSMGSQRVGHD